MTIIEFINKLPILAPTAASSLDSHAKMEPIDRVEFMKTFDPEKFSPKNAAVMALVYSKNGIANLVLILRTSYNGVHSSQVAFPGGKAELFDDNFWATAVRETHEEIGVMPIEIEYICDLTPLYVPPSNFMVYPFLGYSKSELHFKLDPKEVAGIIEISLNDFLYNTQTISKNLTTTYMIDKQVNGFAIHNHFIWGATAMILSELKDLLLNTLK
jgi:8-oxo-dGTP pyrophosphatase MutT (NUDIX family)